MKALVGSWDTRPPRLLAELTALRTRVAELQRELAEVREENAALRRALLDRASAEVTLAADEAEVALTSSR
jgi:transposase-like protein